MKIYTSYYGNSRKLTNSGIVMIAVSLWKPKFFHGPQIIELAPTRYMLSDACKMDEYLRLYKTKLRNMDYDRIMQVISAYSNGKDVALCCYEKPGDFCHRHLIAEWLKSKGVEVSEFGAMEDRVPKIEDPRLF